MNPERKPKIYRDFVDHMVNVCQKGLGQIPSNKVRKGIWIQNVTPDVDDEHVEIHLLLQRMTKEDREIMARLLEDCVVNGVFETLKALEDFGIKPFDGGYEGSPYHDFIGRLDDWDWPEP